MFSLGAGKKINAPGKVFVPQRPVPKPQQVASLTGDNTKVNAQVAPPTSESTATQELVTDASKSAETIKEAVSPKDLPPPAPVANKPVVVPGHNTASTSSTTISKPADNKKTPASFAPKGSKAVSFAPLSLDKAKTPTAPTAEPAVEKSTAKETVPKAVPKQNNKATSKAFTPLSNESDDEFGSDKFLDEGFEKSSKKTTTTEAPNSLQAKMPKKRKIATEATEVPSTTKVIIPSEEDEEGSTKTKKSRMKKGNSEDVPASSSSSGSAASQEPAAHGRLSSSHNALIMQPSSAPSSSKQKPSNSKPSRALSSSSTKKRKTTKATQTYSIFPISFGTPTKFRRIRAYVKLTSEGADGLIFKSVDNIPVLSEIDASFDNAYGLELNDVVVSVNNLDARYSSFNHVMQALRMKADESRGAIGTNSVHVMNGNNNNISEGTGIIQKNAVVRTMACIVFARPEGPHISAASL